jgi:hypothetical protein
LTNTLESLEMDDASLERSVVPGDDSVIH